MNLLFRLVDTTCGAEGECQFTAYGLFEGRRVGFGLSIKPGLRPQQKVDGRPAALNFQDEAITIHSLGAPSDALLAAVANYYNVEMAPRRMAARTAFRAAATRGTDPARLATAPTQFKLSYQDKRRWGKFAELLLNFNVPKGDLYLHEIRPIKAKDPRLIIEALSQR